MSRERFEPAQGYWCVWCVIPWEVRIVDPPGGCLLPICRRCGRNYRLACSMNPPTQAVSAADIAKNMPAAPAEPPTLIDPRELRAWLTAHARYQVTASCRQCAWWATMRGDTELEALAFMKARLESHLARKHDGRDVESVS